MRDLVRPSLREALVELSGPIGKDFLEGCLSRLMPLQAEAMAVERELLEVRPDSSTRAQASGPGQDGVAREVPRTFGNNRMGSRILDRVSMVIDRLVRGAAAAQQRDALRSLRVAPDLTVEPMSGEEFVVHSQ